MATPIETLDFADLSESYQIGLKNAPRALVAVPKGLIRLHEAFWHHCLFKTCQWIEADAGKILILGTDRERGFRHLVSWLMAGPLLL